MPGIKNPVPSDLPVDFLFSGLPADFLAGFFYEFKPMGKRILNS